MSFATMPPMVEYRQEFKRQGTASVESVWAEFPSDPYKHGQWWKEIVFSRISKLEQGSGQERLNPFSISEQVASRVRSRLSKVSLQSLPLPTVVPLSDHGLSLSWASGTRSIELTAFADGEITVDALETEKYVDLAGDGDLEAVLKWLIMPTETQAHVAAR